MGRTTVLQRPQRGGEQLAGEVCVQPQVVHERCRRGRAGGQRIVLLVEGLQLSLVVSQLLLPQAHLLGQGVEEQRHGSEASERQKQRPAIAVGIMVCLTAAALVGPSQR